MSRKNLYAIYDRIAEEASQPFIAVNNRVALRMMNTAVSGTTKPEDFRLYKIGELSVDGLKITPLVPVEEVFSGENEGDV